MIEMFNCWFGFAGLGLPVLGVEVVDTMKAVVPAGVEGTIGGGGIVLPPQPAIPITTTKPKSNIRAVRRRFNDPTPPISTKPSPNGTRTATVA